MKRQIGLAVVCVVVGMLSGSAGADLIDVAAYQKTVKMTVAGYSGGTSLAGFPVLVKLSESDVSGFRYQDLLENGTDLRFTDENRNIIPYEVDTWNTNGVSLIWVKVPSLSAGTVINAYWGNTDTGAAGLSSKLVWTTDYVGVWHLNEGGVTSYDSTTNALHAANYSVTTNISDGKIGAARRISNAAKGTKDSARISVPYSAKIDLGNTFTISGWMRYKAGQATGWDRVFGRKSAYDGASGWEVTTVDGASSKLDVRGIGSTSPQPTVTDFTVGQWVNLAFVFSNTTVSVYLNGTNKLSKGAISAASDNTNPLVFGNNGAFNETTLKGSLDEVRYRDGLASADWIKAEYETVNQASFLTYGTVSAPDVSEPIFKRSPSIVLTPDGAGFEVSAELSNGSGDLIAVYGPAQPYAYTNLIASGVTVGVAVTNTLSGFPIDKTLTYAVVATNPASTAVSAVGADVFLSGDLNITKTADAAEENFVHGTFTLTRPATATNHAFTVAYTVSGTAVASTNYVPLSGYATFPVGVSSTTIDVVPLLETANANSPTLTVTLVPGLYFMGDNASASMTIQNWNPPADKNCWVGSGNASVAANWTQGVPKAGDNILLGVFSSADMTWDVNGVNGLTDTVASWTQDSYYTGTVTFPINYTNVVGATFTNLTVTGDAVVNGGKWTHPLNTTSTPKYHLAVSVGGTFTLGAAASIDASQKGYAVNVYHPGSALGAHGGASGDLAKAYDSPYQPFYPGSGGANYAGGGAIWIDCAGAVVLNGAIKADSIQSSDGWNGIQSGAGGSVYVRGATIAGAGTVSAKSSPASQYGAAAGGRVALEVVSSNTLGLPETNLTAVGSAGSTGGSGGTVVTKTANQAYGTLIVSQVPRISVWEHIYPKVETTTPVVGTWTFDAIKLSSCGILSIPTGSKLVLPNGFVSVSGNSRTTGILYYGGTIDAQGANPYTFSSNWVFQAGMPYVVTGNVQVINNGAIGQLLLYGQNLATYTKASFSVVGDMTVDATSWLYARQTGLQHTTLPTGQRTAHGGQQASLVNNYTYGSALNPTMPGTEGHESDSAFLNPGGGVLLLNVSGTLELNGKAEASGWYTSACEVPGSDNNMTWSSRPGSGGSINITAGRLTGTGSFKAPGLNGNHTSGGTAPRGSTGGGRVSVRLTDPDALFSNYWLTNITAKGASCTLSKAYTNSLFASAGTVYLQTAANGEGRGSLYVRDYGVSVATNVVTWLPAASYADAASDFRNVSLVLAGCAHVRLSTNAIQMVSLNLEAGSTIDLNGKAFIVRTMKAGGAPVGRGTYASGSSLFTAGYVLDSTSGATGTLTVLGEPSLISIR